MTLSVFPAEPIKLYLQPIRLAGMTEGSSPPHTALERLAKRIDHP